MLFEPLTFFQLSSKKTLQASFSKEGLHTASVLEDVVI